MLLTDTLHNDDRVAVKCVFVVEGVSAVLLPWSLMSNTALCKVLLFMIGAKCSAALIRRLSAAVVQRRRLAVDSTASLSTKKAITDLRKEYSHQALVESDPVVKQGPFKLFEHWLSEACAAKTTEPNAMCLSTCSPEGRPSARYVLLKGVDERGFVWYTNYESRKGQELQANGVAALTFWWGELERQVRIEGAVHKLTDEESSAYFSIRPPGSQMGAWSSQQSRPIADRAALEAQEAATIARFQGQAVTKPPHWGGFRLVPDRMEFWKGRGSRLHDRLLFVRSSSDGSSSSSTQTQTQGSEEQWTLQRLQP